MPIPAAAIPYIIAGAQSLIQGISSASKEKKAEGMIPSAYDPAQAEMLEDMRRNRRQIETGTDALTVYGKKALESGYSAALEKLGRTARTPGEFISGANTLGTSRGTELSKILATSGAGANQMLMQQRELEKEMVGRRFGLEKLQWMQKLAEAKNQQGKSSSNLNALLARFMPSVDDEGNIIPGINLKDLFGGGANGGETGGIDWGGMNIGMGGMNTGAEQIDMGAGMNWTGMGINS